MNHFALFDILFIGSKLQKVMDNDFSLSEINILSYLACLMSIYDGEPARSWGYSFTKSKNGLPISSELVSAISGILKDGWLVNEQNYYSISEGGLDFLSSLKEMGIYTKRISHLESAIGCISLTPFGIVRTALFKEPVLSSAKNQESKLLLDEEDYATANLYEQFKELKKALHNKHKSLIIPALTWLSSNLKQQVG